MIVLALLAQVTDCTTYGNQTRCTSQPGITSHPPIDYSSQQTQMDGNAMRGLGAALRERKYRRAHKRIGKLIADGKCGEARGQALRDGNLDLAQQVAGMCP